MMEIIDFNKKRREWSKPNFSYFIRVDVWPDGITGSIVDQGDNIEPELLQVFSDQISTLARLIEAQAYDAGKDLNSLHLATVKCYASGRILTICGEPVKTEDQHKWVDEQLDFAKQELRPEELRIGGTT